MTQKQKPQERRILYVRALDCEKAPDNMRTTSDPVADSELGANIGETGLVIQNLIGLAIPRKKGRYHIYGGGRRLDRVHENIAAGKLPEDYMVPVFPAKDKAEALWMSLAENYYKLSPNPADECRGFKAVLDSDKNKTPADVAKQFGVTERFVLGRLRLSGLAENIFEALRLGQITLDVAKAYGSTADADRQAMVYSQLGDGYYRNNVNEIRRHLAIGSYRGGDPKALLIGRDAYVEAGGRIDSDLFSDQASEIWRDGDIVERLVERTLADAADAMRQRDGFAEVRVVSATSIPWDVTRQLREVEPEPAELTEEAAARQTEIEAELAEIERVAEEADGYSQDQEERVEILNAELEDLTPQATELTPAQKANAIAYVLIGADGTPKIHEEFYAVEAQDPEEDDEGEPGDEDEDALDDDEDVRDEGDPEDSDEAVKIAYSQRLRDELAMMKTKLLAVHIANDPQFALDLGTFIMADEACRIGWNGMPSELKAREPAARVHGFEGDTPADKAWVELDERLDRTWLNHAKLEERYDAFCELDPTERAAWLGWAIARTMNAIPDGGTGSVFLNHLGGKLAIDVAAWWRPTARNFFDRLTKPMILGLLEDIGGATLRHRYATARKFDLAVSAEKLFAGETITDAEVKERAVAWLPSPMRFAALPVPLADEDVMAEQGDVVEPEVASVTEPVSAPIEANDVEMPVELPQAA